jgi:hypothetical protein
MLLVLAFWAVATGALALGVSGWLVIPAAALACAAACVGTFVVSRVRPVIPGVV